MKIYFQVYLKKFVTREMEYSDETQLDVAYKLYKDCASLRAKLLRLKVPEEFIVIANEVIFY